MKSCFSYTRLLALAVLALLGCAPAHPQSNSAMLAAAAGPSAVIPPVRMSVQSAGANSALHILVGQSVILHDVNSMRRIYVGNPSVLQTFTSGPQEVVVTAKAPGSSSLVIWDTEDHSTMYNVHADLDSSALQQSLRDAYPLDKVQVQGNEERISLTGTVATPEDSESIDKLATQYSKDVVNSIRIVPVHGKQVQLKLRIAEVDRTKLDQFGINLSHPVGGTVVGTTTGMYSSTISAAADVASISNPLNFSIYNFAHNIGATVQDLESHNILQILAEPTLTTLSGKPASFLSGGEFPFPVAQAGSVRRQG
jgi:pilus assembly protein CpaC